jgi:hypothetical protein
MVNIKKFIDRVSAMDSNPGKNLVLPTQEARALRDEIVKLMADKLTEKSTQIQETIEIQLGGGRF